MKVLLRCIKLIINLVVCNCDASLDVRSRGMSMKVRAAEFFF